METQRTVDPRVAQADKIGFGILLAGIIVLAVAMLFVCIPSEETWLAFVSTILVYAPILVVGFVWTLYLRLRHHRLFRSNNPLVFC